MAERSLLVPRLRGSRPPGSADAKGNDGLRSEARGHLASALYA
jgi:hypothetical protein